MPPTPGPTPTPTPSPPTVPLTGTAGLFPRWGTFATTLDDINTNRGTTIPADVADVNAQFETTDQNVISNLYPSLSSYQSSSGSMNSYLRNLSNNTVIQMVTDVQPQPQPTLLSSLVYIVNQMTAAAASIKSNTLGVTVYTGSSNVGNAIVVVCLYDSNGKPLQYAYEETIFGTCTNDSNFSANLALSEPYLFQGQPAVGDMTSWQWPAGSGCSLTTTAVNPLATGGLNWTNNGSFETWTGPLPSGWLIVTGTIDGTISRTTASGTFYDGTSAIVIAGITGGENTEFQQQFRTSLASGSTNQTLYPLMQLAFNCFIKTATGVGYGLGGYGAGGYGSGSGGSVTGTLRVALVDGSGTVIDDAAGNANSVSQNIASLSGWNSLSFAFCTPAVLPSTGVFLDFKMTTALSAGNSLYIDRVGLTKMTPLYPGGPGLTVFSGNVPAAKGDSYQVAATNNYAGKYAQFLWRIFALPSLGLVIPNSGSPTISDY